MERTLVKMVFGSQVYGTSLPTSDTDYKSVFVPDKRDLLLQRATKVSRVQSTGDPHGKNLPTDVDHEQFSLHGYMKLLCEGQTVAVDMLFVPKQHWVEVTADWASLVSLRDAFISRSIAPFVGYCHAQANKYGIKGSRMAAAKAAAEMLAEVVEENDSDARVGEFPATLEQLVLLHPDHVELIDIVHPATGAAVRHLSVCGRKAPFTLHVGRAAAMYDALWQAYGQRARDAMENQNVDWKAMMHAVRIAEQAIELLKTGHITFPRPNVEVLLEIRQGRRTYASVAERIESLLDELRLAGETSTLREAPSRELADDFILDVYEALF